MRETARTLPPLIVDGTDDSFWNDQADVIVVGFGGAGAAAALEARERGAEVLAIDRFNGGGATSFDGSTISGLYAAGRTAVGLCSLGYMTGLAIADTVFSGRRAGRHASARVRSQQKRSVEMVHSV